MESGLQNIVDGNGLGIAVTGMSIVLLALALIALFIAALPRVLQALSGVLPPERERHAAPAGPEPDDAEALAVAIGFALHSRGARPT